MTFYKDYQGNNFLLFIYHFIYYKFKVSLGIYRTQAEVLYSPSFCRNFLIDRTIRPLSKRTATFPLMESPDDRRIIQVLQCHGLVSRFIRPFGPSGACQIMMQVLCLHKRCQCLFYNVAQVSTFLYRACPQQYLKTPTHHFDLELGMTWKIVVVKMTKTRFLVVLGFFEKNFK